MRRGADLGESGHLNNIVLTNMTATKSVCSEDESPPSVVQATTTEVLLATATALHSWGSDWE